MDRADLHLKIVQEISELVNHTSGLDTILNKVVGIIAASLRFDVVTIYLWDEKHKFLEMGATHGLQVDPGKPIRLKIGEGLTGYVFETRRPLMVSHASAHPRYKYFPETGEKEYDCYIGVPILLHNHCLGVLIGQTHIRRMIIPAEETLFEVIASRLAGLLEVADRLERLQVPARRKIPRASAFQGKGVSSGFAVGPVSLYFGQIRQIALDKLSAGTRAKETRRLLEAIEAVENDLTELIHTLTQEKCLSESEINIFKAHIQILRDEQFRNTLLASLKKKRIPAEAALHDGIDIVSKPFESHPDPYLQDRSLDFRDLGQKIMTQLFATRGQHSETPAVPSGSIVVAAEIDPALLTRMHQNQVAGIVTEKGGETSHTAILARSLGIPSVCGIPGILDMISPEETLLVDGTTGFIFPNPSQTLIGEYRLTHKKRVRILNQLERELNNADPLPVSVKLSANIGFPPDIALAHRYQIPDVGLFRTEFAFMQYDRLPSVEEQVAIYEHAAKSFPGYVTIRTLDIGAEKTLPYMPFPKEDNPLLGLRSVRFSMEYPDIFRDQIRAILFNVQKGHRFRILLPMVTNIWEVETAHEILGQLGVEIGVPKEELPLLGIMLEVPSVLFHLENYKDLIDFVSVGSNDFIQYLLAVDRNSNTVGHLYTSFHPAVMHAFHTILSRCRAVRKPVYICGELSGTVKGALAVMALGFQHLSILPSLYPTIRYLARRLNREILVSVKQRILLEKKSNEIERYLTEVLESLDPLLAQID